MIRWIKKILTIENFLLLISIIIALIIIGKMFHLNNYFYLNFLTQIYSELNSNLDNQLLKYLFISLSATLTLYILSIRNKQLAKQSETQYDIFIGNSEFNNFLEATKILTDKDFASEAKIASLYLLYDISKQHNDNVSRIIQVINKAVIPLINCLENNCSKQKRTQKLISTKKISFPHKIENKYIYTYNYTLGIDDINDGKLKRIIKEWQYNGNDTERLVSVSLTILKKIFLKIQPHNQVDLSNTVLFDLDTDYEKDDIKILKNKKPLENLIFLNCKLHKVDFSKVIYHQASFINCDLKSCNFTEAILWGTLFNNCELKDVKFNKTECEATEFKNCKNLIPKQLKQMKFQNKTDDKKYLIICQNKYIYEKRKKYFFCNKEINKIPQSKYFSSLDEFNNWKYEK